VEAANRAASAPSGPALRQPTAAELVRTGAETLERVRRRTPPNAAPRPPAPPRPEATEGLRLLLEQAARLWPEAENLVALAELGLGSHLLERLRLSRPRYRPRLR
jgi:hypothetical protein